jgi:ribA/ribD-fused uncharacterized protein
MRNLDYSNKSYNKNNTCWFQKVDATWGGLSNMSGKNFPMLVNKIKILSSEALYQACRFPDYPEIQETILKQASPMAAKMKTKPFRNSHTRADFEENKIAIMYWCLQVKLACNPNGFGSLLKRTGLKSIVEVSHKDKFWGTVPQKDNPEWVEGTNILGQLLMQLRDDYNESTNPDDYLIVEPLKIPNFNLLGNPITLVKHPSLAIK